MKRRAVPLAAIALLALSFPAVADIVWPSLVAEDRLLSWWAIVIGLVIEFFFVRRLFSLTNRRAALATIVANAASTFAGIVLIPLSGVFVLPLALIDVFGAFGPLSWIGTFALVGLINTFIEVKVYEYAFVPRIRRQQFLWLLCANALSAAVAFASLLVFPPKIW